MRTVSKYGTSHMAKDPHWQHLDPSRFKRCDKAVSDSAEMRERLASRECFQR